LPSSSDEARAYRAKLASLQFAGRGKVTKPPTIVDKAKGTKSIPVPDDDHGKPIGGYQIEHKDGRVDAVIMPEPARIQAKVRKVGT
jgi:hypothetical protein